MPKFDVDLFVIGAGSGGIRAARIAAAHGATVMIAEQDRIGGTCIIRGCVPKKLMVYASRFSEAFADAKAYGWSTGPGSFDWDSFKTHRDAEVAKREGEEREMLERAGVSIHHGHVAIENEHMVRLDGGDKYIRARFILVATGAHPVRPDIPGAELAIASNEIFHLPEFPRRLVILGGGYIGVEFAGIFAGLGSAVTHIYREPRLLDGFDADISTALADAYAKRGIALKPETEIRRIMRTDAGLEVVLNTGAAIVADQVLLATGRAANTEGFGLETSGVKLTKGKAIAVDAYSCTAVPSIYAIGDVTNRSAHTPVAIREGQAFADTVFGKTPTTVDHTLMAIAVFSTPEIGMIGLSEAKARETHGDEAIQIYKKQFQAMRAALPGHDASIVMKLVAQRVTGKILGVHIIGDNAAEIIQSVAIAVTMGATKADFDRTMAVHPTDAEELITMAKPSA